ncbi:DUF559 domain-containing protein [Tsukamurella ocularis]|uniref:DUF559 domain-containing protein n=1 Tax=Tsukamurella ocularis TaxID=1970234 RepID=UPI002169C9B2|nr:DUF559 domain-containing protein [Tsukamurella ocularis]MCS3778678.1 very-short-patch-repair endonuclease [Tsukamurella ocularis]MCS3789379.1 very-short-patch-repair endonuclease [Tsukamurella ocularis]MCS3851361.1 very-short-patch-repair endonuclease [Tsukamurella ocularis]
MRNALAIAYPDAVFTGWTAAAPHGALYTEGHAPEIRLPQQRTRKGVIIRVGRLNDEDVEIVLRRRATSGALTAADIARHTTDDEAIAGFDQCLRVDRYGRSVTTKRAVQAYLDAHPRFYGARRVLAVLAESSTGTDSHWETYTRLAVHRSGLTFFTPQSPVPGTQYHVDLGDQEHRIAIEYDGGYHRSVAQQRKDIRRWNAITDQKWVIIRVTSETLTGDLTSFVARIVSELRRRGWSGPAPAVPRLHLAASTTAKPGSFSS